MEKDTRSCIDPMIFLRNINFIQPVIKISITDNFANKGSLIDSQVTSM